MANVARGVDRVRWEQLPDGVRVAVQERLGAAVTGACTAAGGFSHGMAALLELSDGRVVFGKAIEVGDGLIESYRTEAATGAALPVGVPAPRLLCTLDGGGWLVMVFEAIPGRHPRFDRPRELAAALDAVELSLRTLTPSPMDAIPTIEDSLGPELTGSRDFLAQGPPDDLDAWSRARLPELAAREADWAADVAGTALLHTDLRPDNMRLRPDGTVVLVDWAWSCRGAAWVDLASLLPELLDAGVDPDTALLTRPVLAAVDPSAIEALFCALTGYWERNARLPAPPRSPNLRRYQASRAALTREWLQRRFDR